MGWGPGREERWRGKRRKGRRAGWGFEGKVVAYGSMSL